MGIFNKGDLGWIEKIPLTQFSNKALILSGRFVRVLRSEGQDVQLNDPTLAEKIVDQVCNNDNPKLQKIFIDLYEEFKIIADSNGSLTIDGKTVKAVNNKSMYRGNSNAEESKTVESSSSPEPEPEKKAKKQRMYRGVLID